MYIQLTQTVINSKNSDNRGFYDIYPSPKAGMQVLAKSTSELYTQSGSIQWDTDVVIQFKFFILIFCISSLFDLIVWMFFICIETKW